MQNETARGHKTVARTGVPLLEGAIVVLVILGAGAWLAVKWRDQDSLAAVGGICFGAAGLLEVVRALITGRTYTFWLTPRAQVKGKEHPFGFTVSVLSSLVSGGLILFFSIRSFRNP